VAVVVNTTSVTDAQVGTMVSVFSSADDRVAMAANRPGGVLWSPIPRLGSRWSTPRKLALLNGFAIRVRLAFLKTCRLRSRALLSS
jgi:hypothetical protein